VSVVIECPEGGTLPHNVVPDAVSGSASLGHICAHGEATLDLFHTKEKHRATSVYAKIFDVFDVGAPQNQQAPPDALRIGVDADGFWRSENVPGARHAPSEPLPLNVLVIWATFAVTGGAVIVTRNFLGQTADVVDCCEGSGSGLLLQRRAARPAGVALSTVPLLWALIAAGFEGARVVFNGPWALALRPGCGEVCVWDNGGDGARVPLVRLHCESPLASAWRLTLRNGDGTAVEYARPADEWAPLGPNVLRRCGEGAPGTPESLTLTPG
jgi:hypothetical protein